ncbi:MAG TPA: glycosyltransferase family 4 protein [Chloroflexota bacterium]|jgi:glycosyltransferase involved in cell wall biosynthesis
MLKTLLVINATLPPAGARSKGPRKDYEALAERLHADVLDRGCVERSPLARRVARGLGMSVVQAWLAFRRARHYDVVFTDGEGIGLPLALLLKLVRARCPHVTIGHRLSTPKKRLFFRWLGAQSHISRIALHSVRQREIALRELGIAPHRLALVPYQVDSAFWCSQPIPEERLVCSAGLEHRDYSTLFRAVQGLDVQAVIGAASYWSHQRNTAADVEPPANVEVGAFDYVALRNLYARAAIVVVPLADVDFQAGVTTILEAMAMGKAVIVTHTQGQTDVVEDRRSVTRGTEPRPRPVSLLQMLAGERGVALEPTGFYVPPDDPGALRRAIVYLLDHPEERARLGAAGRRTVEQLLTLDHFVDHLSRLLHEVCAERPTAMARSAAAAPVDPRPSRSA